jgi:hypothetical protein
MTPPWKCRSYKAGDEEGILRLYRLVFERDFTLEFWRWVYSRSPDGPAAIAVLEDDEGIVGHYAVQPRKFWDSGEVKQAGIAIGTMVLPRVRSVGALMALAENAYALCRDRGYEWLYAFPNDEAHIVRCKLLGWKELPPIVEWEGPLPKRAGTDGQSINRWQTMPDSAELSLKIEEASGASIHSARSTDWLRWRFFEQPAGQYCMHSVEDDGRVVAYAVTKRYRRDGVLYGHIVDWQAGALKESKSVKLLSSVWRQLAEWNVDRVSAWAQGDHRLQSELAAAGLAPIGQKTNFCWHELASAPSRRNEVTWRMVMADSDRY